MAKKISGKPKFDLIQLMELSVNRGGDGDGCETVLAYADSKSNQMFGHVTLASNSKVRHFSKKTEKLLSELFLSIEEDAAKHIFGDQPIEETKEGIHVSEPEGIVDAEETTPQI